MVTPACRSAAQDRTAWPMVKQQNTYTASASNPRPPTEAAAQAQASMRDRMGPRKQLHVNASAVEATLSTRDASPPTGTAPAATALDHCGSMGAQKRALDLEFYVGNELLQSCRNEKTVAGSSIVFRYAQTT